MQKPIISHFTSRPTLTSLSASESFDLELRSPSKINLFLRVTARRDDGFHDLASLFQAIALSDRISFSKLDADAVDDVFECNMEGVPTDKSNLVLRAFDVFRERSGVQQFFRCRLDKTVPAQAGLGGGSGNAATALYGANVLCGQPATHEELLEWSKTLGSDATFFMSEGTAYCTGRGEILTPVPPLPATRLFVVKPDVGLSTPSVFQNLDLSTRSTQDPLALLELHTSQKPGVDKYVNDLEPPAFALVQPLRVLKERLMALGFDSVAMSGSGTSLFCMGTPPAAGWQDGLSKDLPWRVTVYETEFLNRPSGEWYK
uniref:GHMP kinase N-terminal domain-containing protein n=1 Tax=Octactis speculum TaxID=3111310 RepID=A0A7S2CPU7_9STRA